VPLFERLSDRADPRARERFGDALSRVRAWVERDRRPWVMVRCQRAGQGHALQVSICPAEEVDAMRGEILAAFGEPAAWRVERFTDGQTPRREVIPTALQGKGRAEGMSSEAPWVPAALAGLWNVPTPGRPPDG
jgi:hypothetical protein